MNSATQDLLHQRIIELVYDEEKTVTCLSVANELKVSANDAKNLLEIFVKDCQEAKLATLYVTYLLSGTLKDNKGVAVYLVKEEDLNNKKDLFHKISTELIYSVQKTKQIDFNIIASTNSACENLSGLFVSKNCIKRHIPNKKLPISQPVPNIKDTAKSPKTFSPVNTPDLKENGKNHTQQSKLPVKPKQKGGIASFFAKAPIKTENYSKVEADAETKKPQTNINTPKSENDEKKTEGKKSVIVSSDDEISITTKASSNDTKEDKKKSETKENVQNHSNKKKRKKDVKNSNPNKRRKRIQELADSDSSDPFDGDENEDIIQNSDEEPSPVFLANSNPAPKNKKRKAVDKMYADEEGFFVTTTEYIYESASEEEKEIQVKPPPPKIVAKKTAIESDAKLPQKKGKANKKPVDGKQPTLMSFFKKN